MSLVDYASSDDDAPETGEGNREVEKEEATIPASAPTPPPVVAQSREPASSSHQQQGTISYSTEGPVGKLPDASLLFDSPLVPTLSSSSDHTSRVAAAQASRKRESNVPFASAPRGKLPRGMLPHMKKIPETSGGMLVPPQLSGRSNIVTEDISKLFVKTRADPSSQR